MSKSQLVTFPELRKLMTPLSSGVLSGVEIGQGVIREARENEKSQTAIGKTMRDTKINWQKAKGKAMRDAGC